MPPNDINAIDNNPVNNIAIPTPLNLGGILEYLILYLIDAKATIAKKKPTPEPKP